MDVESVLSFGESLELSGDLDLLSFNLAHLANSRDTRVIVGVENADSEMFSSVDHLFILRLFNKSFQYYLSNINHL